MKAFDPAIPMVDLATQHQRIQTELDEAMLRVARHGRYIKGPEVAAFESDLASYLGAEYVIGCGNGTDALQIALMALGLEPGDEVISPAFTYIATAEVIALLGLTPRWVDVDPNTFTLDPEQLAQAITPQTKAIIPVHLYGQAADMERIMAIAKQHSVAVVEDNAQAIGASYTWSDGQTQKLGTIGTIGCTSFFPSKNLGCMGDGGAISTQDAELAERIRMVANHGQRVKYRHDIIGINSRLDTMQAAILQVKLPHLDAWCAARLSAAERYDVGLASIQHIQTPARQPRSSHVFHQYTLRVLNGQRDALQAHLKAQGIPSMIYYPLPLHLQPAFASETIPVGSMPTSEQLCQDVISLPMHPELTADIQDIIINQIKNFFS